MKRCAGRRSLLSWNPRFLLVWLILGTLVCCAEPRSAPVAPGFLLGGIQVNEPDLGAWHDALLENGFNAISLTTYAKQGLWNKATLDFTPAEQNRDLAAEMESARRKGLRVVLIPRVALDHAVSGNEFLWHGLIQPRDEELDRWFERYGEFVLGWAREAEEHGVEVFGLGSELSSLTSTRPVDALPELEEYYLDREKQQGVQRRALAADGFEALDQGALGWGATPEEFPEYLAEQIERNRAWAEAATGGGDVAWVNRRRRRLELHWRNLIDDVREVYSGRITYAANFDQYHQVGFWDALDVIGINAYFPLRSDLDRTADDPALAQAFTASWSATLDAFEGLVERDGLQGRPFLFTEMGYTRRAGATLEPWAGDGFAVTGTEDGPRLVVWKQQPVTPVERALAVRSLHTALGAGQVELEGLLWWKLSTVPEHRDVEEFLLVLGESPPDPLLRELQAFRERR